MNRFSRLIKACSKFRCWWFFFINIGKNEQIFLTSPIFDDLAYGFTLSLAWDHLLVILTLQHVLKFLEILWWLPSIFWSPCTFQNLQVIIFLGFLRSINIGSRASDIFIPTPPPIPSSSLRIISIRVTISHSFKQGLAFSCRFFTSWALGLQKIVL